MAEKNKCVWLCECKYSKLLFLAIIACDQDQTLCRKSKVWLNKTRHKLEGATWLFYNSVHLGLKLAGRATKISADIAWSQKSLGHLCTAENQITMELHTKPYQSHTVFIVQKAHQVPDIYVCTTHLLHDHF